MSDNSARSGSLAVALPPRRHLVPEAVASIRAAIAGGRWPVGAQLPSEPQLATDLGVSRATLREGLRLLVSERLLDRRPGVGTFVARVPAATIERGIDELFSLHQTIAELGHRPSTGPCTISFDIQHELARNELRLDGHESLCRVRRVRLADDRPVILCHDYFPLRLLQRARTSGVDLAAEIASAGSLYLWLEERHGTSIDSAIAHIASVNASLDEAVALDLAPGTALLRLRQTHFTLDGRPVLYSDSLHSPAFMHFHVRRRRVSPTF
jgi:DNA-binding GntR family transcriptional regulator